ncbi:Unknown protein sequence [Pseudomonas meliae]|uniref:Uncharacterized protein n=1 Tax=Pseudomonas meliae TaxID=86176 RepID=A0A0P9V8Q5_9PSED|nr:Unknown protein sequence [Pseudomonas meliae]
MNRLLLWLGYWLLLWLGLRTIGLLLCMSRTDRERQNRSDED